jgi:cell division protein ZapE
VVHLNESVADAYDRRVAAGEIVSDAEQRQAAQKLDEIGRQLWDGAERRGWLDRLIGKARRRDTKSGIYLRGKVGRGKTMLLDMFFEGMTIAAKRRIHFNAFMQDVHGILHGLRQTRDGEAVAGVARRIAEDAQVLCLDEFQVNDITDAMLLGRLFEALIAEEVFIVVSSNTEPDRLYEDGLNRRLFVPFIRMIKERFHCIEVAGRMDYRLRRMAGEAVYVWPLGDNAEKHMQRLWDMLNEGAHARAVEIKLKGRALKVPLASRGAARFSFAELCEAALGSADYLALSQSFNTIFIDRVPRLGPEERDAMKRFIKAIDIFYDQHVRVVVSADAPPDELGPRSPDYDRTASRLEEMRSRDYWASNGRS